MKKTILLKIVTLVILNVFVISLGLTTFATTDSTIMPRWSYLGQCGYSFEVWEETDNYDVLLCGGDVSTTNPNHYAYVEVELQYLSGGTWRYFDSWEDEAKFDAIVEEFVEVTPGYSYRLSLTYKVLDANKNVLETFTDTSSYTLTSLPRN